MTFNVLFKCVLQAFASEAIENCHSQIPLLNFYIETSDYICFIFKLFLIKLALLIYFEAHKASKTLIYDEIFLLAKKLISTISSPKSAEPESVKENELKPKRSKRKLYSTDISCPLDIPVSSVSNERLLICNL